MQKRFVVLGGGTAGWITAARLAAERMEIDGEPVKVTLIESSDVPTIGVGEGTWPTMRATLEAIGLSEVEFIRECNASFKQASRFINWGSGSGKVYDHPFTVPPGMGDRAIGKSFYAANTDKAFDHWACVQSTMIDQYRAPKQVNTPEYAGVFNYGYHLDAGLFAELLKKHCRSKLNVEHCIGHFESADRDGRGWITALNLSDGRRVEGDFFVDASGTHNKLIGGVIDVPFVSLADYSPNDRAIALPVFHADPDCLVESATLATAQDAGWIWDIGLQHRRGTGYVYSSSFIDDTQALDALARYVKNINPATDASQARKIIIRPGYHTTPWVGNCIAVGMAAGFIEPLEASALVMVELAATYLCENLPTSNDSLEAAAARYNKLFTERWERIRDFLQLHYRLSNRRDTAYWRAVTEEVPLSAKLADLLGEWRHRDPIPSDFGHYMELFPPASYLYVLMGQRPDYMKNASRKHSDEIDQVLRDVNATAQKTSHYLTHLPTNRAYYNAISRKKEMA